MEALFDALLYIVIIGAAFAVIGILLYGISLMLRKIKRANADTQRIKSNRQYMRKHIGHDDVQEGLTWEDRIAMSNVHLENA